MATQEVTVTPTVQSVTVGTAPYGGAGGDLTGQYPSPTIDQSAMQRRSFKLWSDFANLGDWNSVVTAGATITFTMDFNGCACYAVMKVATGTLASRGWISERNLLAGGTVILAGAYEMECSARVRLIRNGDTETGFRIGFIQGHVASSDPPGDISALNFQVAGTKSTWQVVCTAAAVNYAYIDTGIAVNDWHVLRVWVNAAGTLARWYIDGVQVHEETDPTHLPNASNTPAAGNRMHAGAMIRVSNGTASIVDEMHIDWMFMEYKYER
jgi:hypothetical protein